MRPQGSTISEWPKVSRPFSCLPPCAAANTKQPFSMARARISTCQCASPVCWVKAEGIASIRRAGLGQRAIERREAQVVADRQAEPAPRQIGKHRQFARPVVARLAIALAAGEIDVEHVDLVVARDDLAVRVDQERAVGRLVGRNLDRQRADMEIDSKLARQLAEAWRARCRLLLARWWRTAARG